MKKCGVGQGRAGSWRAVVFWILGEALKVIDCLGVQLGLTTYIHGGWTASSPVSSRLPSPAADFWQTRTLVVPRAATSLLLLRGAQKDPREPSPAAGTLSSSGPNRRP